VTLPAIVPDEMTGLREAEDSSAQLPGKICASHSCSSKLQPLSNFKLQIKGANAGQLATAHYALSLLGCNVFAVLKISAHHFPSWKGFL
jgi:hypothetical protein